MKTVVFWINFHYTVTVWERKNAVMTLLSWCCVLLMVQNLFETLCQQIEVSVSLFRNWVFWYGQIEGNLKQIFKNFGTAFELRYRPIS